MRLFVSVLCLDEMFLCANQEEEQLGGVYVQVWMDKIN